MSNIIRVARNASANCVVFYDQTNPTYFNSCLSASVVDTDYVSVTNEIASTLSDETYEYYRIHYTRWQAADYSTFTSAVDAAAYINSVANVTDLPTGGFIFSGTESLDFTHDETTTSILLDNGDHHGINALRAVAKDNGKVGITSARGDYEFYELEFSACTINGQAAATTLQTTVNDLNAFFTLSAMTTPIPAPVYTMEDGENIAWQSHGTINPIGDALYANGASGTKYHGVSVYTSETINEPGEYFTFEASNSVAAGGPLLGLGLYSVDNGDLAEITNTSLSNSGLHGYFFSTWLYNYSGYTAPWTTYGDNAGLVYGPGWSFSGSSPMFRYSDANTIFRTGEGDVDGNALFKVGITDTGFVGVWYYDIESAGVDGTYGARTNDWVLLARSSTPLPEGEYGLHVKIPTTSGQIMTNPIRFATDAAAPTLYYRYIESPDGEFDYPLFASEEEAEYVDSQNGGAGAAGTETYLDDVTGTTWYKPVTGFTSAATSAPSVAGITYTEIATADDSNYVPSAFSGSDISAQEDTAVNIVVAPVDATFATAVSGLPTGLVYNSGARAIQGTLPLVTADTDHTISVTRSNSFGSSIGTFVLTITDVAPPQTNSTPWTKALDFSGSSERAAMVSNSWAYNPMQMGATGQTVSAPASGKTVTSGYPWATTCVFKNDGNSSNQHIWNLGEGASSQHDNIYLRTDQFNALYFGWGRQGAVNEQLIVSNLGTAAWYGCYIGFNGRRLSGNDATSSNLSACFDIKLMFNNGGTWIFNPNPGAFGGGTWSSTGGRMDRDVTGSMTIGGRGTNRSYHGKVASFVTTTLNTGADMPDTTEITEMITDPLGWLATYKVGSNFRRSQYSSGSIAWNTANESNRSMGTQVFLMGDGANDSYSNMIRNRVSPNDQNYTKLNMVSMVSNDIETVNIPGLT